MRGEKDSGEKSVGPVASRHDPATAWDPGRDCF